MNFAQMLKSRSFSLKAILAGLVVLSVAPAIAVAGWLVYRDYQARSDVIYRDAVATARSLASIWTARSPTSNRASRYWRLRANWFRAILKSFTLAHPMR